MSTTLLPASLTLLVYDDDDDDDDHNNSIQRPAHKVRRSSQMKINSIIITITCKLQK